MNIAQYLEEQKRLNQEPKHWWQRTSPWYERIAMLSVALGGLVMAVYVPVLWITAPAEIIGNAGGLALGLVVLMTGMGFISMTLGALAAFHSFTSSALPVSHLEAAVVFAATVTLALAVGRSAHEQIEVGQKLAEETKALQAKIQMLEQQRLHNQWRTERSGT